MRIDGPSYQVRKCFLSLSQTDDQLGKLFSLSLPPHSALNDLFSKRKTHGLLALPKSSMLVGKS